MVMFQLFLNALSTSKTVFLPAKQDSGAGAPQRHLLRVKGNIALIMTAWRTIADVCQLLIPVLDFVTGWI